MTVTAIDTNILLDLFIPDAPFGAMAQRALERCARTGRLVICEVVYAELAPHVEANRLDAFLEEARIRRHPTSPAGLERAGRTFEAYCRRRPPRLQCGQCGAWSQPVCPKCKTRIQVRQHLLADFLIGAHAVTHAGRLLTRDQRIYRTYFPDLKLLDPTTLRVVR
jgi:predicted nucleic acid-binding protein